MRAAARRIRSSTLLLSNSLARGCCVISLITSSPPVLARWRRLLSPLLLCLFLFCISVMFCFVIAFPCSFVVSIYIYIYIYIVIDVVRCFLIVLCLCRSLFVYVCLSVILSFFLAAGLLYLFVSLFLHQFTQLCSALRLY